MRFFDSLDTSGSDDIDGDGANNAQEEIAGTDPTDRESVLRLVVSVTPAADAPGQILTLSWPGLTSRSYFVQSSENLVDWKVVSLIPGTDGATTYEDDENFPTDSNDPPLYYRIVVSGS